MADDQIRLRESLDQIANALQPAVVVAVIVARVRQLTEADSHGDHRDRVAAELEAVEAQVANLADAIAMTSDVPALAKRLQQADARRHELARNLEALRDGTYSPPDRLARHRAPGAPHAGRLAGAPDPSGEPRTAAAPAAA